MALRTSGQQQDLPGEETDQGVEAVNSIQNVHLADHESKKEEYTLNIESKQERLGNGETASVLTSLRSQETSPQSPVMSKKSSNVKQKQKEAKEASERLIQMENEHRVKELEIQKLTAELQLTKQRTDDARKVAALNKSRAEEAERRSQVSDNDTVQNFLINRHIEKHSELPNENKEQRQTFSPIRLKGVDLPIFSGQ
ncbi:Hypothetical predicted protein [Paramuricea clavata]|uniref:Uncharacterized protein n=1 Tax=Paramuricea clavata TaxID=317549 RepID=A0A7D9LD77_PARCT|nr:Hypothetical predicted protein [Paramuricea clavata]